MKVKKISVSIILTTLVLFGIKLLFFNSTKCLSTFEIGQESNDIGRIDIPIEQTCKKYQIGVGWYIEDLKVLFAWKKDETKDLVLKSVHLYTVKNYELVKLAEPSCRRHIWNEERKESAVVLSKCEEDADYSILIETLNTVTTKQSEDKRYLMVEYRYTDSWF